MTFIVEILPSGGQLYHGLLALKRTSFSDRHVFLTLPCTISDVKTVHDLILQKAHLPDENSENMSLYGHLTLSAISGYALLVLVGQTKCQFLHFSQIQSLRDEVDLKSVCHFALVGTPGTFRFKAASSVDYKR